VAFVAVAAKQQDTDRRILMYERLEMVLRDLSGRHTPRGERRAESGAGMVWIRDSAFRAAIVFAALVVAGFVALVLAWIGVSGTLNVGTQVAYAASGGIGGLALVISGAGLFFSHVGRWAAAREDASLERVIAAASHIDRSTDGKSKGAPPTTRRVRRPARRRK
jgi:hypothetical protein